MFGCVGGPRPPHSALLKQAEQQWQTIGEARCHPAPGGHTA
eukprot:CAMPEP_0174364692 /NCGR_PEP_ID=MMETSP0811_2-20130205/73989_1 /TAXON_ID=73025 ORGANISM="Eutreptiella gymnastica-like, Strain CCMP1594" /NCGR_SAMPLE_ID=MMETSP0811_2 /ASSEMBLY_ACC=CAM_ASM_000667 /LENGTH=40 /DNA_ID= /DNA_START= /DNA_END= /DNA_ORIENTATION=